MSNYNGRIDLKTPNTSNLFSMYDKISTSKKKCKTFRNPTGGLWIDTPLSNAYFSEQNMIIIQNGIRAGVYEMSNSQYLIGYQDCDYLKIVMRSIFLQYCSNKPTQITEQIAALNQMVLNYCIAQVYSEAQGYLKYLDDVSTLAMPIAHPILANNKDKELVLKSWF
jgi:hypothetical protein